VIYEITQLIVDLSANSNTVFQDFKSNLPIGLLIYNNWSPKLGYV